MPKIIVARDQNDRYTVKFEGTNIVHDITDIIREEVDRVLENRRLHNIKTLEEEFAEKTYAYQRKAEAFDQIAIICDPLISKPGA
jgi:hypothetical protein